MSQTKREQKKKYHHFMVEYNYHASNICKAANESINKHLSPSSFIYNPIRSETELSDHTIIHCDYCYGKLNLNKNEDICHVSIDVHNVACPNISMLIHVLF